MEFYVFNIAYNGIIQNILVITIHTILFYDKNELKYNYINNVEAIFIAVALM